MICLGIESTAHTFSVGLIDDSGKILGLANDTYIPDSGGLIPQKVTEHHYAVFYSILQSALSEANVPLKDVDLISFSKGPGLGGALTIGATLARALSLKLKIPIVGVNHSIAHVEIGRKLCNVDDPLTLYASGGNTIVSAFQSGRYQIFGETLDLAVGNMLDKIARKLGIPHPGGPRIEKIAKKGKNYIELPFIVKGMDISYSGLFSATWKKLQQISKIHEGIVLNSDDEINYDLLSHELQEPINDLIYSFQETAFAMLAEVCERALAHTKKNEVLLTGGVAANNRLAQMIEAISEEHHAKFNVVPRKVAGDNGAMIAWNGIEHYNAQGGETIEQTQINTKWRMDTVLISWRDLHNEASSQTLNEEFNPQNFLHPEILQLQNTILLKKGAEASILRATFYQMDVIVKYRRPKTFRNNEIDKKIRTERTLNEARILLKLQEKGINVPSVYFMDGQDALIVMQYIKGISIKQHLINEKETDFSELFYKIGVQVGKIHNATYIHGDLTTSNIILLPNQEIVFIDFGLGDNSSSIEDRSMDLHLFKRVLQTTHGKFFPSIYPQFIAGYRDGFDGNMNAIIDNVSAIELRGRYVPKDERKKF